MCVCRHVSIKMSDDDLIRNFSMLPMFDVVGISIKSRNKSENILWNLVDFSSFLVHFGQFRSILDNLILDNFRQFLTISVNFDKF